LTIDATHLSYLLFEVLPIRKDWELRREFGERHGAVPKLPPQL